MALGNGAQRFEIPRRRRHAAHVAGYRLYNHGCDLVPTRAESVFHGACVVEGQSDGGVAERLGDAGGVGYTERRHARAGLHQQGIHVAVITSFELHYQIAPGEAAGQPYGRHGGFGPGADQARHLDGGHGVADGFGQLHLALGGRAETGAPGERAFEGVDDDRMTVAEQQRSPGPDVVDVLVAIHVEDVRALAARDERRVAAHGAIGAHGRVDAARYHFLRPAKQLFGFGSGHKMMNRRRRDRRRYPVLRGARRLKPRLMPIS